MSLTKAEILAAPRRVLKVLTPEWPDGEDGKEAYIYVRSLSGTERNETLKKKGETDEAFIARLATLLISNADGTQMFTEEEGADLMNAPEFTPIERAIDMGLTFNARTEEAQKVLAENSEAMLSESIGSA